MKFNLSINNRVLVEPYKKTELKAEIRGGMAMISQKVNLKGLKLMANARVFLNGFYQDLYEGDVAYFREDQLHMSPCIKDVMSADAVEGQFIIVDANMIQFVQQDVRPAQSSATIEE